jgi:hypothetical protein
LHNLKLDLVAFLQTLISLRSDGTVMYEYIGATFMADESVTLGVVKPLHGSFQTFQLSPLGHVPYLTACLAIVVIVLPLARAVKGWNS